MSGYAIVELINLIPLSMKDVGLLVIILTLIEVTPIKLNPWQWLNFYGQGEPVDPEQPLGHWTRASEAHSKHLVHQVVPIEQPTSLSNYSPQKGGTIGDCAIFAQSQKDEMR